MHNIKLRPATMSDAEILFKWRNDPETIRMSRHPKMVIWEDHLEWLLESLKNPNRQIWIAWQEDISFNYPVGTCKWDYGYEWGLYEISWIVAPLFRKQGVGKVIVSLLTKLLNDKHIIAEIKRENFASAKIAEAAGMKLDYVKDDIMHYYRIGN